MLLQTILLDFWDSISGKSKTRSLLQPYVTDEALYQHVEMFEGGFPQYRVRAEDIIEQADKVVVRAVFSGTHTGEFNGIPATGKSVELPFIIIYRFENGKIAEHWLEANHLALLTQLGVMNTEAATA
ncbi:ester cyclase [Flavisolibacter sp. BT320]|nr:ester cyclase [Flavisolibacter longurius]